jgi:hypothetical protein
VDVPLAKLVGESARLHCGEIPFVCPMRNQLSDIARRGLSARANLLLFPANSTWDFDGVI